MFADIDVCDENQLVEFPEHHWNVKHGREQNIMCKVVSYWNTTKSDGRIGFDTEYRLVDDELNYVRRSAESAPALPPTPALTAMQSVSAPALSPNVSANMTRISNVQSVAL